MKNFDHITYTYLPREDSPFADDLAKLALMMNIPGGIHLTPLSVEGKDKLAIAIPLKCATSTLLLGIVTSTST